MKNIWHTVDEKPKHGSVLFIHAPGYRHEYCMRRADVKTPYQHEITMAGAKKWAYLDDVLKTIGEK